MSYETLKTTDEYKDFENHFMNYNNQAEYKQIVTDYDKLETYFNDNAEVSAENSYYASIDNKNLQEISNRAHTLKTSIDNLVDSTWSKDAQ